MITPNTTFKDKTMSVICTGVHNKPDVMVRDILKSFVISCLLYNYMWYFNIKNHTCSSVKYEYIIKIHKILNIIQSIIQIDTMLSSNDMRSLKLIKYSIFYIIIKSLIHHLQGAAPDYNL